MECGRIRWWSKSIFVGKALSGELIALEPQQDGLWTVWFFAYPVGVLDERKRKITKQPTLTKSEAVTRGDGAPDRRA
jgi:putative transposase